MPPTLPHPRSADGAVDLDRSDACYDTSTRIVIKIVDTCPCQGNEASGAWRLCLRLLFDECSAHMGDLETTEHMHAGTARSQPPLPPQLRNKRALQKWCCGDAGLVHFDLSDGAFRKLAPQVGWGWLAVDALAGQAEQRAVQRIKVSPSYFPASSPSLLHSLPTPAPTARARASSVLPGALCPARPPPPTAPSPPRRRLHWTRLWVGGWCLLGRLMCGVSSVGCCGSGKGGRVASRGRCCAAAATQWHAACSTRACFKQTDCASSCASLHPPIAAAGGSPKVFTAGELGVGWKKVVSGCGEASSIAPVHSF